MNRLTTRREPTEEISDPERRLEEFRRQLFSSRRYDDIIDHTEAAVKALGAAGFIYWTASRSYVDGEKNSQIFERERNFLTARGPLFMKAYEALYLRRRGLVVDDPTIDHLLTSTQPFTTGDVYGPMKLTGRQKMNFLMMHRFGIHHDLFIPLHTPRRYQLLYVFALGKEKTVEERLLRNRNELVRIGDLLGNAVGDFVDLKNFEESVADLSVREQECLNLLSRGCTNKDMAAQLNITERTVKFHVNNLLRKFNARTRAEAVAVAARSNWLTN